MNTTLVLSTILKSGDVHCGKLNGPMMNPWGMPVSMQVSRIRVHIFDMDHLLLITEVII